MRSDLTYPQAERLDLVEDLHGHRVADPYRWLEDVTDERTVAWSAAQDKRYEAERANWPLRERFHDRLATLHAVGSVGAPTWRGDRSFAVRRDPGQDHEVLRVSEPGGIERVLVDPIAVDASGTTTLDFYFPSPDGTRLAYGLSEGGTELASLRVLDVKTAQIIEGPIDRVRHSPVAWLPDSSGYYYVRHLAEDAVADDDPTLHRRVYLHTIGSDPESDQVVFGDGAPRATYFDVSLSHDGRWLVISSARGTDARNDLWLADLRNGGRFTPVQLDVEALTYMKIAHDGRAYLHTNRDAPRWRLCVADPSHLASGYPAWHTLLAEDPNAVLVDYVLLDDDEIKRPLAVALRTRHAIGELTVHDLETGASVHDIPLPAAGTVSQLTARRDGGHEAWFGYTDFTHPDQIRRYDATTAAVDVWATPAGDATTSVEIVTKHVTYPSYDGTEIRMFLASAKSPASGPARTILYGYGGFNIARPPVYDPYILAWIEEGGIFALVSLRGGSEEGETWHRAGMLESKQNVFDDFAAAADWLVSQGLTTHEQIGIFGGSNGGLLVGAALTQHPEKYGAVVCSAPLLDMVRYEQFGMGANWSGEYGTASDPAEFEWLYAYSPYHHVTDGVAYPAVVFTVFDGDTRVDPLHARKLCAALQHATSSGKPVLIRRELNVGHASRAVSRTVELAADRLAFFTAELPASGAISPAPASATTTAAT
jgi:prolyl oligopeptidase